MEITAREAARRMQERHRLSRDVARRVLASGLAGPGRRVPGAVLFDEETVEALLDRRMCERWLLDWYKPLIVRLGRERELTVTDEWSAQAAVAGSGWYVTWRVKQAMSDRPRKRLPLIATIGGFVAFGGDIVSVREDEGPFTRTRARAHPTSTFELEPPALWWGDLEDTWLPIRNGPTWSLWDERYTTPRLDPLRADPDRQIRDWEIADRTTSTWALRAAAARAARPPDPR